MKTVMKAKVVEVGNEIDFELGSTQAYFTISGTGTHARRLKLKTGDKVEITVKKLK